MGYGFAPDGAAVLNGSADSTLELRATATGDLQRTTDVGSKTFHAVFRPAMARASWLNPATLSWDSLTPRHLNSSASSSMATGALAVVAFPPEVPHPTAAPS